MLVGIFLVSGVTTPSKTVVTQITSDVQQKIAEMNYTINELKKENYSEELFQLEAKYRLLKVQYEFLTKLNQTSNDYELINPPIIIEHYSSNETPLSKEEINKYEKWVKIHQRYVQPNNPVVLKTVKSHKLLKNSKINLTEDEILNRSLIFFEYINGKMDYAPEPIERKIPPAITILKGRGDCEDFCYLYISLLRASGVPQDRVRGVYGRYMETDNKIMNHSYPEVKIIPNKLKNPKYREILKYYIEQNVTFIWLPVEVSPQIRGSFFEFLHEKHDFSKRYFWYNDKEVGVFLEE